MYTAIGIIIGLVINHLVIKPIRQKRIRNELVEKGIIPKEEKENE